MDFKQARENMVTTQIISRGVSQKEVIEAFRKVPRHKFVDESLYNQAYNDYPLSIGYNQTISQPYIVAYMTEKLDLKSDSHVLEIGTGCGYQTAILSEIVEKVYTIEIVPDLFERARKLLSAMGYNNIEFKFGSGFERWSSEMFFDRIIVTSAPAGIPQILKSQLKINGKLILPTGIFHQKLKLIERISETDFLEKNLLAVRFVKMVD